MVTPFCAQRLTVICNLCQADSPLGQAFRLDNSLQSIPDCPFKDKPLTTINPPSPRPYKPYTGKQHSPKTAISSSQWEETISSFPQEVRDIILSGGLNAWLESVGIPPCTCSCRLAQHQAEIRKYAISQGWLKGNP